MRFLVSAAVAATALKNGPGALPEGGTPYQYGPERLVTWSIAPLNMFAMGAGAANPASSVGNPSSTAAVRARFELRRIIEKARPRQELLESTTSVYTSKEDSRRKQRSQSHSGRLHGGAGGSRRSWGQRVRTSSQIRVPSASYRSAPRCKQGLPRFEDSARRKHSQQYLANAG